MEDVLRIPENVEYLARFIEDKDPLSLVYNLIPPLERGRYPEFFKNIKDVAMASNYAQLRLRGTEPKSTADLARNNCYLFAQLSAVKAVIHDMPMRVIEADVDSPSARCRHAFLALNGHLFDGTIEQFFEYFHAPANEPVIAVLKEHGIYATRARYENPADSFPYKIQNERYSSPSRFLESTIPDARVADRDVNLPTGWWLKKER